MISKVREYLHRWFAPWKIEQPAFLPLGEWDNFYEEQQRNFPIRWAIFHEFTSEVKFFFYRINRKIWEFKHKYIPKHQYHIIRTSLDPKEYHDPRERILYATMDMVKDFVEITNETVEWESDPGHAHAKAELDKVYDWWVNKYPNREEELEPLPDVSLKDILGDKDFPGKDEWRRVSQQHNEAEARWSEEEKEMLERVMKIYDFLWYP